MASGTGLNPDPDIGSAVRDLPPRTSRPQPLNPFNRSRELLDARPDFVSVGQTVAVGVCPGYVVEREDGELSITCPSALYNVRRSCWSDGSNGQDEAEACSVRLGRLVGQRASVRAGVRLRDRETQAGAFARGCRTACEP